MNLNALIKGIESNTFFISIILFIVFVTPGMVSMTTYRLFAPTATRFSWTQSWPYTILISIVIYAIYSPFLYPYFSYSLYENNVVLNFILVALVVFISPFLLAKTFIKYVLIDHSLGNIPYSSATDFKFTQGVDGFLLVRLKSQKYVGGYFGQGSYTTTSPDNLQIYIETRWDISKKGDFLKESEGSLGIIINGEEIETISIFDI